MAAALSLTARGTSRKTMASTAAVAISPKTKKILKALALAVLSALIAILAEETA